MSIIDSFDGKSRAILNPEDIIPRPENFPKTVLASFQKGIVQELHNILQPEEFDSLDCVYRVPLPGKLKPAWQKAEYTKEEQS